MTGHDVQTVQQRGWFGFSNGEPLRAASAEFEVLITGDRNLEFQQTLAKVLATLKDIRRGQLSRLAAKA